MADDTRPSGGRLAELDRRLVPAMQARARRLGGVLARPVRRLGRWEERVAGGRALGFGLRNRSLVALVAGVVVLAGAAVQLQRLPELRAGAGQAAPGDAPGGRPDGGGPGAGVPGVGEPDRTTIGPPRGVDLAAYVDARRAVLDELSAAAEARTAVVSFVEYLTPAEVAEVLAGAGGATVTRVQLRVPDDAAVPVEAPVVADDLAGAVDGALAPVLAELAEEEASARELLESGTVEDEAFLEDLENRLATLSTVRNVVSSGAPLVFAVLVEAEPAVLQALSGAPTVRLVDLGPVDPDPERLRVAGLLPEDRDRTTFGT
ncbi:MAG: hypothetical protein ACLGIR_06925 [Actinomycetes bacterium]